MNCRVVACVDSGASSLGSNICALFVVQNLVVLALEQASQGLSSLDRHSIDIKATSEHGGQHQFLFVFCCATACSLSAQCPHLR